jgi:hypothetical protein
MKTIRLLFLGLLFAAFFSKGSNAQVEYHYFDTFEEVRVGYRWQRSNLLQRNSDAVLNLELTNQRETAVEVSFVVGFYRDHVLILESSDNKVCLKPGQSRRGVRGDLRYAATGINLGMTEKDWFSWEVFDVEVTEVEGCD